MSKHYITALIKICGQEEHAKRFLSGYLYCNRIQYFIDCEQEEMSDTKEAVIAKLSPVSGELNGQKFAWNAYVQDEFTALKPGFCTYAHQTTKYGDTSKIQIFNTKMRKFGNHAVVIKDVEQFLSRIENALPDFSYSLIEYVDFKKITTVFNPIVTKDLLFKHQNEFRLFSDRILLTKKPDYSEDSFLKIIPQEACEFKFDDISDIAEICTVDELLNGKEINLVVDWEKLNAGRAEFNQGKMECYKDKL